MAEWYVYHHDGESLGPWTTEAIADAIRAGKLTREVWIAPPGGPRWLRAVDVPRIARLIASLDRPKRESGLRLVPGAPVLLSRSMIVADEDGVLETRKMPVVRASEDDLPTEPTLPSVPTTPTLDATSR